MASKLQVWNGAISILVGCFDGSCCLKHICHSPSNQVSNLESRSKACKVGKELGKVSVKFMLTNVVCLMNVNGRAYQVHEALEGYKRAANAHGWKVSESEILVLLITKCLL